jgi:hypothetical protein
LLTIRSNDSPGNAESRSPLTARTATRLSRAFTSVVSTARRDTSTAATLPAPASAAATASMPLPVQTSATAAPGDSSRRMQSASSLLSLIGRNTPGSVATRMGASYPVTRRPNR